MPHSHLNSGTTEANIVVAKSLQVPVTAGETAVTRLAAPARVGTPTLDVIDELADREGTVVASWEIEIYFRVLKQGCQVEELRLETDKRLLN